MITPASISAHIALTPSQAIDKAKVDEAQTVGAVDSTAAAAPEGVKVSLSGAGLARSSDEKNANADKDIEESGLPDQAQKILKMIRELQRKIEEKQAEMQEAMADQSLSPEARQAKVAGLLSELSTLTATLVSANNSLDKLSKNGTLSSEQAQQAANLALKKS